MLISVGSYSHLIALRHLPGEENDISTNTEFLEAEEETKKSVSEDVDDVISYRKNMEALLIED